MRYSIASRANNFMETVAIGTRLTAVSLAEHIGEPKTNAVSAYLGRLHDQGFVKLVEHGHGRNHNAILWEVVKKVPRTKWSRRRAYTAIREPGPDMPPLPYDRQFKNLKTETLKKIDGQVNDNHQPEAAPDKESTPLSDALLDLASQVFDLEQKTIKTIPTEELLAEVRRRAK